MDTSNNLVVPEVNTSNIIVMTPELSYMRIAVQEKNELKNIITQQSGEIGRLLGEVQLWKGKYEEVLAQII